jgi:hypothetical protein
LIEAALKLRQLVKDMDSLQEIKGFLLYKPDTTKSVVSEQDQQMLSEHETEILKKFEGKAVADFVPAFMLEQQSNEQFIEYPDFDQCVDEYFSQALKHREKVKLESQENAIFSKMNRI